ncbi:transmembrane protein 72 [Varanus komodoensis]|uniref:transmembrane protein 72 n=1 Tax=Varanus komodoensis TaxID=61221 RepID=UPI001CF78FE4|nr:transmembrane protein 72 [Varanus komodoensis]
MKQTPLWNVLEYACRLLGLSTGAVLTGVGTSTLRRGQFQGLAIYLLVSGMAVFLCEAAYFASLALDSCFVPGSGSVMHTCRRQARHRGAFQKFLAYILLSVACFIHPVLVWHVTIPGTMLVLTGLAYFLLSKQQKEPAASGQEDRHRGPRGRAETVLGADGPGQKSGFLAGECRRQRGYLSSIWKGYKDEEAAPRKHKHSEKKEVNIILSVQENSDESESLPEETVSESALILAPVRGARQQRQQQE